jgi:hypothetical protein
VKRLLWRALEVAVLAAGSLGVMQAQNADPYFNTANPGATQLPLAAPAGSDSQAATCAHALEPGA